MKILMLLCLFVFLIPQPAVAQTPAARFEINPITGQFYVQALVPPLEPGYVTLFVDGVEMGTYFVPPVETYTVLGIVPIPKCSWSVTGDYGYSWFNQGLECFDPQPQVETTVIEIQTTLDQFVEPFRKR